MLNHKLSKNADFEKVHLVFQEITMLQTNLLYGPLNDQCPKLGSALLSSWQGYLICSTSFIKKHEYFFLMKSNMSMH